MCTSTGRAKLRVSRYLLGASPTRLWCRNNGQIWFQMEAESRMAREEIKDRIFDLENQLEGNAEQIRNLVRNIVR